MKNRFLCITIILLGVSPCLAVPVHWAIASGGNDHWYDLVTLSSDITWEQARTDAEGGGGYLATITSGPENDFISSNLLSGTGLGDAFYIGGFQLPDAAEPGEGWTWITGEPWVFQNWHIDEPSNTGLQGNEDALLIYHDGTWNDGDADNPTLDTYIFEVPEPGTICLLGLGGLSLIRRKR